LSGAAAAAIIGAGNVALDCARILSKTRAEFHGSDIVAHALDRLDAGGMRTISILARRGPHQIAMTPKELGELAHLANACPTVELADFPPQTEDEALDPGLRKSVGLLRGFADLNCSGRAKTIAFDFFAKPIAIEGDGKAERVIVERTRLENGSAVGTGETYAVPANLVISCIGYATPPIDGVPYDERGGKFQNQDGRIADRLYCVGWARRGPTGTIGTNRPDGYEVADQIVAAQGAGSSGERAGTAGLKRLLDSRGVMPTDYDDWRSIEEQEAANARPGSPREKFVRLEHWLDNLGR
jgi:ferredoxin--NADP+ reductase